MSARIVTKKITMCEECHYFVNDDYVHGDSRYWCSYPSGPGGKLTTEIVKERTIHKECPLPKVKGV